MIISVPHAGRDYPASLISNLNVSPESLLRLEDRYVDRLALSAKKAGFATIVATRPRAWIDLNRGESEVDPDLIDGLTAQQLPVPSAKVRGGLGAIPGRLSSVGRLWKAQWSLSDFQARIEYDHKPYHKALADVLSRARNKFGGSILLDLHSMPPLRKNFSDDPPQIVIGDRYGKSSAGRYSDVIRQKSGQHGLQCGMNHPYAGGYILDRHGRPEQNIHAIQLEVDRSLYLDSRLDNPGADCTKFGKFTLEIARALGEAIIAPDSQYLDAAE